MKKFLVLAGLLLAFVVQPVMAQKYYVYNTGCACPVQVMQVHDPCCNPCCEPCTTGCACPTCQPCCEPCCDPCTTGCACPTCDPCNKCCDPCCNQVVGYECIKVRPVAVSPCCDPCCDPCCEPCKTGCAAPVICCPKQSFWRSFLGFGGY